MGKQKKVSKIDWSSLSTMDVGRTFTIMGTGRNLSDELSDYTYPTLATGAKTGETNQSVFLKTEEGSVEFVKDSIVFQVKDK